MFLSIKLFLNYQEVRREDIDVNKTLLIISRFSNFYIKLKREILNIYYYCFIFTRI